MPDKLKQMQNIFYLEVAKYSVLPLDKTTLARWNAPKPSLTAGRTEFTYSGTLANVPGSTAPHILNKCYTIRVSLRTTIQVHPLDRQADIQARTGAQGSREALVLSSGRTRENGKGRKQTR